MRKETNLPNHLWYTLSHQARVRLVTLGGLFYTQNELAELLGTTGGTIAGFRTTNEIPMPLKKKSRTDRKFGEFNGLLTRLQGQPVSSNPRLEVFVNPSPPLTHDEKEERQEEALVALIRGRWKPEGQDRPFNKLRWHEKQRIREHTAKMIDRRGGIRPLRF